MKNRCDWVNLNNEQYVHYHDFVWGKEVKNDRELFECLILEMFQSGLSWEIILNKKENFENAFDNFEITKISNYNESKIEALLKNKGIVRNRNKILATINNSRVFLEIQKEFESFYDYLNNLLKEFINNIANVEDEAVSKIYKDLKNKGMKHLGKTTIHSYLCAIGIIKGHQKDCFLYDK